MSAAFGLEAWGFHSLKARGQEVVNFQGELVGTLYREQPLTEAEFLDLDEVDPTYELVEFYRTHRRQIVVANYLVSLVKGKVQGPELRQVQVAKSGFFADNPYGISEATQRVRAMLGISAAVPVNLDMISLFEEETCLELYSREDPRWELSEGRSAEQVTRQIFPATGYSRFSTFFHVEREVLFYLGVLILLGTLFYFSEDVGRILRYPQ